MVAMRMNLSDVITHQRKHGFIEAPPVPTLPLLVESLDRIDFFCDFIPPETTSQQKGERVVIPKEGKPFVGHYKKAKVVEAERAIASALRPFIPKRAFTGPLRIVAEWTWPWRVAEPKKNRVDGWLWKDSSPDCENCQKGLSDQMQYLGFFTDDAQICDMRVLRRWGDRPGIRITLEALTPQAPIPPAETPKPPEPDQSPFG